MSFYIEYYVIFLLNEDLLFVWDFSVTNVQEILWGSAWDNRVNLSSCEVQKIIQGGLWVCQII